MSVENNYNYKMLKLITGEIIICTTDDDCEDLHEKSSITIMDPVLMNQLRIPREGYIFESYVLLPWLSFCETPMFNIRTKHILVAGDIKEQLKTNYLDFIISKAEEEANLLSPTKEGSEAETIENILSNIVEGIEDEEEEDYREPAGDSRQGRSTRTIH